MRSYHFLDVEKFNLFEDQGENTEIKTEQQLSINGGDAQPLSSIKLIKRNYYKNFDKLIIHHEKVQRKQGRAYGEDIVFDSFIQTSSMNAYYNKSSNLLLIEGNKSYVNDFIRKFQKEYKNDFIVNRSKVDFPYLIKHTQNVWGGWINGFNDGSLRSVALYGDRVNLSQDYNRYEAAGQLSSLNCSIVFEKTTYDFMITANKTVVIMQTRTPEEDIDLLTFIKPMLYKDL